MFRSRTLGAVLVALAMFGVLAVGDARADEFTASSYPATATGEQPVGSPHVFTVQGVTTTCAKAHFKGTLTEAAGSVKVTPTYEECTFGPLAAEITTNGCSYEFTVGEKTTVPTEKWDGSVHIRCPEGKTITVEAPKASPTCIVHIPGQAPTSAHVDLENKGEGVKVTSTVEGIHSATTDGFLCPLNSSTETDTGGTYTGTVQFNGTEGKTVDLGL